MIEITEVNDKDTLKAFVLFPFELYKGSRYWVPPLIADEMKTFDPAHNPTLEFCQVQLVVARKQGRVVGRLALIVNRRENELLGQRNAQRGLAGSRGTNHGQHRVLIVTRSVQTAFPAPSGSI